nr:hypothetical protein [Tanacetum cinerariifolium]
MSSLFADTHNVVAILEKSDAAEGFEQIIDFLSGSYIHYALTVNPHIYISCIKQFWNTASVKRSDDVTRLQALVDRKKIAISEDVIREILQLDDAEGVVCLPNEEIFVGLAQMGYEKPSTKLTFYKAFFSSQWEFLIHTLLQSLSGKRTSWNEFSTAMASAADGVIAAAVHENVAEDVANAAIPSPSSHDIPSPTQAQSSPPQQPQSSPQAPPHSADFPAHFQQVLDTCSALTQRVEHLEHDNVAQKLEIIKLKARVKRLERANKVKSSKLKRLRKVGASRRIESFDDMEDVFNQGRMINEDDGIELVKDADIAEIEGRHAAEQAEKQAEIYNLDLDHPSKVLNVVTAASQFSAASATISAAKPSIHAAAPTVVAIYTRRRKGVIIRDPEEELSSKTPAETPGLKDKGKGILIESLKPMKKKDQIELDVEYARKLHEEINKDIDWDAAIDHYDEIRLIFQARFDANMRFLFKTREEMEEEDQEIIKSINKTPAQKAAKRRKLNEEAQEVEDLKKQLEIVNDEDDDVFTEATPFGRKTMFEKPDGQDAVWRNQNTVYGQALVKGWKLLTLCGVHIISLTTTNFILLVERRYPLSKFTLEQLVNATRLQVEEESKMSLELLRFTRQQFQEYHHE